MHRIAAALLFSGILAAQSPEDPKSDFISVKITAAIDETGTLKASVSLQANGEPSTPYREAYGQGSPKLAQGLFGPFLNTRQVFSAPGLNNGADPARPFQFTASVTQSEYIIPVQRVATLQLNPLHELPDPIASGDQLVIGQPGLRRTEIAFEVPPGFELKADIHSQRDSTFARYRSQALVDSGKLIVLRELTILNATVSASERVAVEEFLHAVRVDEQRSFVLRRVARVDPSAWIATVPAARANTLGLRAYDQHEYESARQLFEKSIAANPASTAAWNNLGRALAALGRIPEAQKAYERQITVHPADQFAYNNLALLFERQGDWGRAVENLEKQLQVDPGNSYAVNNLPRALLNAHLWDELETAAQKALIAAPANVSQKLNLAIAHICLGKSTNIREEIDRTLGPNPIAARLNDAAYYLAECDVKTPEIAELYTRRALDLFMNAAPPGAGAKMSGLINRQNTASTFLDTYGWVLFREGKYEDATRVLTSSLRLHPRAVTYAHLALAEARTGVLKEATLHARQAVFLEPGIRPQIPSDLVSGDTDTPVLSLDAEWYAIDARLNVETSLPAGTPFYFFVTADAEGKAREVRALDSAGETVRSALESISFPAVQFDGKPMPTVHIVRIAKNAEGIVTIAHSVGAEATSIASELVPEEFPVAAPPTPAVASAASASTVNRVGGGVSAPAVISKVDLQYSAEARKGFLRGTVKLSIVVGADGVAHDVSIIGPLGLGLDENAVETVKQWRFRPGMKDGLPVNVRAAVEVNFRLLDGPTPPGWHTGRMEFRPEDGATRPHLVSSKAPQVSGGAEVATAIIAFTVDEHGNVTSASVEKASNEDWGREALRALAWWRFEPGMRGGAVVPVKGIAEFVRGD